MATPYDASFFNLYEEGSRLSARQIVPLVMKLCQPKRVIDVGCGAGSWLAVFKEHGVEHVLGVDGHYIDRKLLQISAGEFYAFDLKNPLRLNQQFDLAVSLEVAEHLPPDCAEGFVDSLVRLAPAVLFSAAVPFQGGVNHLNEQWPTYWIGHFRQKGYVASDCIRGKIWENPSVEWWYAQNTLLFVRHDTLLHYPFMQGESMNPLPIVHPRKYLELVSELASAKEIIAEHDARNMSLKKTLAMLPTLIRNALGKRMKRVFTRGS